MVFLAGLVCLDHQVQLENLVRMELRAFQVFQERKDSKAAKAL